jgi:hypothetical protein
MTSAPRQLFDANSLLSPGFMKTFEGPPAEHFTGPLPIDIFKVDVNSYLAAFADSLPTAGPLKPIKENLPPHRGNSATAAAAPIKQNPLQAEVSDELKRRAQLLPASRFGFTKH